jgi:hypothetical protein
VKVTERIKRLLLGQPPPTVEELAAHPEVESMPDRAREAGRLDALLDDHINSRDHDPAAPF